ncbi:MAG: CHAT domain-containing protein [Novosphingobium sp.]|uniref:CHAT domain-containing protein n=1 Tax=Novosphingobium sp. TaxID=1874826 RepID=UPI002732BF7F|nr:CHAT domain-containing tetratricopeptide repeat protein [Novosphingobium sp.]MDP3550792.1 CHAT domain-containing protein [Novosphingobium sp.]
MSKMIWAALLAAAVPNVCLAAEATSSATPTDLAARVKALCALDTSGNPAEALAEIDATLAQASQLKDIDPNDLANARIARAHALYALDRYDEALPILQEAERVVANSSQGQSVDHARLLDGVGSTLAGLGRNDEAETCLSRALTMAEKAAGRRSIAYASAVYGLGLIDFQRGQPLAAIPKVREAFETARAVSGTLSARDIELPAEFGISLSALLGATGDTPGSIEPAREALVWAETRLGDDHRVTMAALNRLGSVYNDNGLFTLSIPILRKVLDQRGKVLDPDDPQLGFTIEALGFALDNSGQRDAAFPFYERGAQIFEKSVMPGQPALVTTAIGQLARVTRWRGDLAGSLALREKAVRLGRERAPSPEHPDVLFAEVNLARELLYANRQDEAKALLDHANAAYATRALETSARRIGGLVYDSLIEASRGNPQSALARASRALAPARARLLDRATPRAEVTRLAEQYHYLFVQHARLAMSAGDAAQAFEALQLANLGDLQSAMSSLALLRAADSPEATDAIRRYQSLATDGARLRRTLNAQVVAGKGDAAANISRQLDEIDAKLRAEDAQLAALIPGYSAQTAVEPATLVAAQASLAKGQALVLYGQDEDGLVILAITPNKAVIATTAIAPRALLGLEKRLRGSIESGLIESGKSTFDRTAAHELYLALFPQPIRDAVKSSPDLRILATGSLAALPFAALVTQVPQGADDAPEALRRTRWLARTHAVSVPLAAVPLPTNPRGSKARSFAGIGAPMLGEPVRLATRAAPLLRSGDTSTRALRQLASLPGAADELRSMASGFPGQPALLIGADATETAVKAAPLHLASVIAFATHGLVGGAFRDLVEPALVLTPPDQPTEADDGLLTASEIAKLRLDADWVILSACDTSAGDGESAPTFSGLARSFVAAGARSLLLSHWPVRDDVASRLTLDTLNGAAKGLSRAEALRRAQLAIIADKKLAGAAHPATWAPFVLVGN